MADLFSEFNDQEDSMPAPDGDRLQTFVDVDANLQRVLGRPAKILGIVYTVLGAAAVAAGLMLLLRKGRRPDNKKTGKPETITVILIGVLALAWVITLALSFG